MVLKRLIFLKMQARLKRPNLLLAGVGLGGIKVSAEPHVPNFAPGSKDSGMYDARMELNVERRMSNIECRVCWLPNLDCTQQIDPKLNPGGLQADRRGIVHRCPTIVSYADVDALAHSPP